MPREVGKGCQFEQILAVRRLVDDLVLEDPSEVVGNKNSVKTGGECGVHVRTGAVADHPGSAGFAAVATGEGEVGLVMFFRQHLHRAEVLFEARTVKLVGLFGRVSLGDHNEAVPIRQLGEGWLDIRQQFDLMVRDGLGEALNAAVLLVRHRRVGELLEAGNQRAAEAVQAVAVRQDGGVLNAVEMAANLIGSVDAVVEIRDEAGNRPLKVDVVLPQRVVGVDEEGLIGGVAKSSGGEWARRGHRLIISR